MVRFLLLLISLSLMGSGAFLANQKMVVPVFGFYVTLLGISLNLLLFLVSILVLLRTTKGKFSKLNFLLLLYSFSHIALIAFLVAQALQNPLNDITTDALKPPQFKLKVPLVSVDEGAEFITDSPVLKRDYNPEFSFIQKEKYPFVISARSEYSPGVLSEHLPDFFKKNHADWKLVFSQPEEGHFEFEVESALFHFIDDVAIDIRLNDPLKKDSVIHFRSRSREGKSDLGVNAKRISDLIGKFGVFDQKLHENAVPLIAASSLPVPTSEENKNSKVSDSKVPDSKVPSAEVSSGSEKK